MYMYSMESFLYKRINKVVRNKHDCSVKTLGPYAALISKVINKRSTESNENRILGKFVVFRGMLLPNSIIEKWKKQKFITMEGYSSSSQSQQVAL